MNVVILTPDSDGEERIEISRDAAMQSKLIASMLEETEDDEIPEIPVLDVSKPILDKVVEFLNQHQHEPFEPYPKPIERRQGLKLAEIVSKWDADFMDALENDQETLFKLILAANYLDIEGLLDLGIAKVVVMLHNCKDADEVKDLLNIEKDITHEEEQMIRDQNPWIFETSSSSETN